MDNIYREEIESIKETSLMKVKLFEKNFKGYILSAMLAGLFVGFGVMLAGTVGGIFDAAGSPVVKIVMGLSFGIALSLVIIGGAELVTGNNFVLTIGSLSRLFPWRTTFTIFAVCFLANWLGSLLAGGAFVLAGLANGEVGMFIASYAETKMNLPPLQLFLRAVFCNILVCMAVWSSYRCKSESGKLIMVFWCLFAFVATGFEHCVANMTFFAIALLSPFSADLSVAAAVYNVLLAGFGNMVGAMVFLAVPYFIISGGVSQEDRQRYPDILAK